jgi:hypothetical protein
MTDDSRRTQGTSTEGCELALEQTRRPRAASECSQRRNYRRAEQQVDPDGILDPAERAKLVTSALRAQAADLQLARLRKKKTATSRRSSEPGDDAPRKLKSPLRYPEPPRDTPSQ